MKRAEKVLYFFLWISSVGYSFYVMLHLSTSLRPVLNNSYFKNDTLLSREKDVSDYEWDIWGPVILKLSFPYVIHLLIALALKDPKHEKLAFLIRLILSFITICVVLGIREFAGLLLNGLIVYAVSQTKNKWAIWISSVFLLLCFRSEQFRILTGLWDEDLFYMFTLTLAWCSMRSLSYALDVSSGVKSSLSCFLGYYFYLPLFFFGPVVTYEDFYKKKKSKDWSPTLWDFLQLLRYLFWYQVAELAIHFLYFNAIHYEVSLVELFGAWELAGLGYAMGQFFHIKYVFFYGFCGQFARLEGIAAPMPPICVGRVHLYSNMWRYFDRGLHAVLVKYIYGPIVKLHPSAVLKVLASGVVFSYVYFWHGTYDFVLIWSVLNCFGIFVETLAREIGRSSPYKTFRAKLSQDMHRRFLAIISVPLFALSMVSNFYFFFGVPVANVFVWKMLLNFDPVPFTCLYLFLYCGCQVSMELSAIGADQKKS